ncbi:MAG: F0F1 ATP synthase subunit A, partial [Lachnospiraceae bacterium]|nr:F0F1 ATP synthase subunit A [Lachnospiraceae bacterium]
MSILIFVGATIKHKGFFKWLKSLINPINILDLFTRPLSLCMRLFGNVLGAFVVMKLVELALASVCGGYFVVVPPILSLYFDLFDGLLQAYVFVFLTSLYIKEAIE